MPEESEMAPDFELADADGERVRLSGLRGRKVVLYFYPADDTPGCTRQACDLRDRWSEFRERGAVVLGVSPDGVESHDAFRAKYDLPFTLLADPEHAVADAYGVWKEKNLYGRKHWGVERTTFVIDEEGRIARVFRRVKADEHAERVLDVL